LTRIANCELTAQAGQKFVRKRTTIRKRKRNAKQKRPKPKPRLLTPCPQQPCRHHDQPNCARFRSDAIFVGRAEGGDRSFHRPTGKDLRWPGSRRRGEHARTCERDRWTSRAEWRWQNH